VEAGYPGGIDPKAGAALEFSFDLGDTSPYHRQIAELMVDDMKQIGIKISPILNNKPRFFQKLFEGQMQLFRISWVGDYPDAENFLQLFYSPNAGKCNRVFYKDKTFDAMFEKITAAPDSPERTKIYSEMSEYITSQCPWIFESYPVSYQLVHGWVENFIPHNFANARWKYLSINEKRKKELIEKFKPISLDQ
jgi:ABC-type transport system substrate-binding protein